MFSGERHQFCVSGIFYQWKGTFEVFKPINTFSNVLIIEIRLLAMGG